MDRKLEQLLERIAVGVEKMGADPEIEFTYGPPLCPTCGEENPVVTLPTQSGGVGHLGELVVDCECKCGATIYVVIESYSCHKDRLAAVNELTERGRGNENL